MSPRLKKPVIAALSGVIAGVAAAIASSTSAYTPLLGSSGDEGEGDGDTD